MKAKDLRVLSREELEKKAADQREELFRLGFQHATRQLENTARLHAVRLDIARIETVLREIEKA